MLSPILGSSGVPQHTQITLRTRLDNDVDNLQPWAYAMLEWASLQGEPSRFEKMGAVRVNSACPVYNCHGLTFGNRRTQVDGSYKTISMVLEDDGYVEVPESEIRLGDVVIYFGLDGDVSHSGIVLRVGALGVPEIWSKWGKGFEMAHPLGACPYDASNVKYYRITKWKFQEVFAKSL